MVINLKQAFYWAKIASENGEPLAQTNLGRCYQHGWGTDINYEEALRWTKIAAKNGDPMAMHNLATFYREGSLLEKDFSKAKSYYEQAANMGLARAMNDLGVLYQSEKEYDKAAYWYNRAMEQKESCSFKNLGRLYAWGKGVPLNEAKAIDLFIQEADQNDSDVKSFLFILGTNQLKKGIEEIEQNKDFSKGLNYIDNAIRARVPGAYLYCIRKGGYMNGDYLQQCWSLGGDMSWIELELLRIKKYNEQDLVSIVEGKNIWKQNVWECDEPIYLKVRGLLYLTGCHIDDGRQIEQDYDKALFLLKQSASAGQKDANYWLGFCYEFGLGTKPNLQCAVELYEKAMRLGSHEAAFRYSVNMLNYGNDEQNASAVAILEKIVYHYNPQRDNSIGNMFGDIFSDENWMGSTAWRALCIIGDLYYSGFVYDKSEEQAVAKWEQAAVWGSSEACFKLGEYYSSIDAEKSEYYFRDALFKGYFDAHKQFCSGCKEII